MKQQSLLPEPRYNPKMPPERILAAKALRLMLGGMQITHPEFEALTGSWRLAAHIYILRKLGWPVLVAEEPIPSHDDDGRKSHMGLYYLPQDCIDMVYNNTD